jgi:hypothetical protein
MAKKMKLLEGLTSEQAPEVKKLRKKLGVSDPIVGNDSIDALRILVSQHRNMVQMSVSTGHMARTEVIDRKTGAEIKRNIPPAAAATLQAASEALSHEAEILKAKMERTLRGIPIYEHFLKHVSGVGPVLSSYLVAEVDIRRCEKPSALRRFCGMAVIDGHLERLVKGQKRKYNANIRTQLYLAFVSLWKNAGQHESSRASKYYKARKELELFHEKDRHLSFEMTNLPQIEQKTRAAIDSTVTKQLLFSSGKTFERRLLFTQTEAMNYAAHLAQVLHDQEDNPLRKEFLATLSERCTTLHDRVMGLLKY